MAEKVSLLDRARDTEGDEAREAHRRGMRLVLPAGAGRSGPG
jgi:hypothetical protein